jgi:hypothetical protein
MISSGVCAHLWEACLKDEYSRQMLSVARQEMVRECSRVENAPEVGQETAIVDAGQGL